MKGVLGMLAILLIVAGIFLIVIGYGQVELINGVIDDEDYNGVGDYPPAYDPDSGNGLNGDSGNGDSGDGNGYPPVPPWGPQDPVPKPKSIYIPILDIILSELELIGLLLCIIGFFILTLGGKL